MLPYWVSKLAIALVSPLGSSLLLTATGLLLSRSRARNAGALCIFLAMAWLWLWSTPAVSEAFQARLEMNYPARPATELPRADAIVVLGGAMAAPSPGRPYPDLGVAADRVWHAARVFRAGKAPLVLVSGGSDPEVTQIPESRAIAGLLQELGVPAASILEEPQSRNTRENAQLSAAVLRPWNVRSILLVTSALHMRRSVIEFERVGFQVVPAATDHVQAKWAGIQRWLPDAEALDASARAMKEIVGSVAAGA